MLQLRSKTCETKMLKKLLIIAAIGFSAFFIIKIIQPTDAATTATAVAKSAAKAPFSYGVWLPFWKDQEGASDISINLDHLHEVSPFSYEMNSNGTLVDSLNVGSGSWDPWFGAVQDAGVKIIPTIAWFNTQGIYNLLSK